MKVEELRQLDLEATPGKWQDAYWPIPTPYYWVGKHFDEPAMAKLEKAITGPMDNQADARLIAKARNLMPAFADLWEAMLDFFAEYDGQHGDFAPTDDTEAKMRGALKALEEA